MKNETVLKDFHNIIDKIINNISYSESEINYIFFILLTKYDTNYILNELFNIIGTLIENEYAILNTSINNIFNSKTVELNNIIPHRLSTNKDFKHTNKNIIEFIHHDIEKSIQILDDKLDKIIKILIKCKTTLNQ